MRISGNIIQFMAVVTKKTQDGVLRLMGDCVQSLKHIIQLKAVVTRKAQGWSPAPDGDFLHSNIGCTKPAGSFCCMAQACQRT